MNERIIKELAEEAGFKPFDVREDDTKFKKFAQLIVKECEKVAKDPQWYGESPSNGWRNPIRHVCNVMKEHFGVEK
jgi:hypothetical protein